MPRRNFRGSRRSRGPGPKTNWENLILGSSLASTVRSFADIGPEQLAHINGANQTAKLHRLVGHLTFDAQGQSGPFSFAAGICVVTVDAINLGNTALPDPIGDLSQGWYWWQADLARFEGVDSGPTTIKYNFDIRTTRVLRGGYTLALNFEAGVNGGVINLNFQARALWSSP